MIVFATPSDAPVWPNKAARSERFETATLSIDRPGRSLGDRHQCRPHPGRGLNSAIAKHLLIAERQFMGCHLHDIRRSDGSQMPQGLNDRPCRTARRDQVFGRSMAQIDNALSEDDAPRRSIGEIGAFGWNLGRKSQRIRRPCSGDLHLGSSLAGQGLRHIIGSRRQCAELCVHLGEIVKAPDVECAP